jgi:hypothetical protein
MLFGLGWSYHFIIELNIIINYYEAQFNHSPAHPLAERSRICNAIIIVVISTHSVPLDGDQFIELMFQPR